jgi:alpha-acetolactate decarboxylase
MFVPKDKYLSANNNEKKSMVRFKIFSSVKKTYTIRIEGSTKHIIDHIMVHKSTATYTKLKEQVKAIQKHLA